MTVLPALLFGATSILGFQLARSYRHAVLPFITPRARAPALADWPVLQLHDRGWIEALMKTHEPNTILYCHAVCDVPKCEAAPDWAWEMNVNQIKNVLAALVPGTRFIYVSSDHVFGGDGIYQEESPPCPISAYGRTRVTAESLVLKHLNSLVIRIGLPIGLSPNGRTGHLDWLRYRSHRKLPVTIVHDEHRSAVWASDLAERIIALAQSPATGICHVPATRAVSRVQLANHLLSLLGIRAEFRQEDRRQRSAPHLGHVELATVHSGPLFEPLASVLDKHDSWLTSGD